MPKKHNENWDQEVYDKYHKLACKIASDFSRKYKMSYEDFKDEAEYALTNVILLGKWKSVYRKKKGAGSTWMYQRIYWKLKDYVIACAKERSVCFSDVNENGVEAIDSDRGHSWVEKIMLEVSEEAGFIIKALISAPAEIIQDERKSRFWIKAIREGDTKVAKQMIKDYAINEKDVSKWKYNDVLLEVQSCL